MIDKFISSVAAGALLVGVAVAPMSFAQETTTPPAPAPETQVQPAPATPAPADQAQTPAPADKTTDMAEAGSYLTEQADDQISANTYIGQSVYNANDESIGEINDLIIKKEGGVAAAIVGVGGFLGIGEKNVAVPFESIEVTEQPDSDALKLTTTETAESLKGAPEFKTKSQLMAERNAAQPVDTSTTSATGTTPAPAPAPAEPAPQQ
ncbi:MULTISPECIES: PRC-barrel domain-containing protein [Sinorhizobium]|uniref:PRC-barrel domain-containing protein n=1 Tax=Rhizobium fredii TaxID=380 RepID=A0A2L0H1S3_RHIFR|nr:MULTISPECIES: PRC-barrel domain-containing protein [Sinorhizobium]ASY55479.1 putative transmembrane signal peptide protein [Sinorhizobium sp. CCBAU 05631]AUX75425.1 PRC-barrel domain-containing protein [Sinorhizobium fredii]PDT52177.1 photosystem reaction center subunit H [Sinorhizobium sp. NG07B]POH27910.1 photosystem reaction center subunit H [Sinorhizobium americanum]